MLLTLLPMMVLLGVLGTQEVIIIAIALLLLFGGKKIPELMRGLGKGIREFNDAKDNVSKEIHEGMNDTPKSSSNTTNTTANNTTAGDNNASK